VLGLVAEGFSNRAMAARLFVTERTVEAHAKQVFLKLEIDQSRTTTVECSPSWRSYGRERPADPGRVEPPCD
jgi:ATP/maltotriose-dependent transcriptional regulator MalT